MGQPGGASHNWLLYGDGYTVGVDCDVLECVSGMY